MSSACPSYRAKPPHAACIRLEEALCRSTVYTLHATMTNAKSRLRGAAECTQIDDGRLEESLGFPQFTSGEPRLGWLMNFNAVRCSLR